MLPYLWISVLVLALDQVSKLAVIRNLAPGQVITLLPFLNLTHAHNPGAAFGLFSQSSGWQNLFFIAVAIGVSAMIVLWLWQLEKRERWTAIALALVLGGAIGNLVDRVVYGYVIDFIDVVFGSWHFWTFNIADSAITMGAALLVFDTFIASRSAREL